MTTILIVRHGQTDHNILNIVQGHSDTKLNNQGLEQATLLGQWFKSQGVKFDACWSSDLKRCVRTTENIFSALDDNQKPKTQEFTRELRERSLGELEDMHWDLVEAKLKQENRHISYYGEVCLFFKFRERERETTHTNVTESRRFGETN